MSTLACQKNYSIVISDPCASLTSADWQTNPGNCRLRIKNFNPADWVGLCPACLASGLPAWDGTFSVFDNTNLPPHHLYNIGTGFSLGGKQPLLPVKIFCDIGQGFGGDATNWILEIGCDNGGGGLGVFNGLGPLIGNPPTGTYGKVTGCSALATLDIEAYSL